MYSGELALKVEKLEWDLEKFLKTFKQIPDSIKISLLLDVAVDMIIMALCSLTRVLQPAYDSIPLPFYSDLEGSPTGD